MNRNALINEYWELLRHEGLEHLVQQQRTAEEDARVMNQVRGEVRRAAAAWGEPNPFDSHPDVAPARERRPHADTADRIEKAVRALGLEIPGPVFVGVYPHRSFNAQARAMRHGTLLLINVGLPHLITEVALAFTTRMRILEHDESGSAQKQETTKVMQRRQEESDRSLASSLAAYILHQDSTLGGRQGADMTPRGMMGYFAAMAANTFAIAHEYGHFFAGHLNEPNRRAAGDEWLRKSHEQELEADEIGMLLALKAVEVDERKPKLPYAKEIAVQGAFLFFAIDHLLNRVRNEIKQIPPERIVSDHPPSDIRAATLRQTLTELEGSDILQLADAFIPIMSSHEQNVISELRRLVRQTSD